MSESLTAVILLCITAVIVAAVLGVLAYGAAQAGGMAHEGYTFFDELGKPDRLNADALSEGPLPIAAVAAIIRSSKTQITALDCRICHTGTAGGEVGGCLQSHLYGRGLFILSEDAGYGYTAVLSPAGP